MSATSSLELLSNLNPIDYAEEDFEAADLGKGMAEDSYFIPIEKQLNVNTSTLVQNVHTSLPLTNPAGPSSTPALQDSLLAVLQKEFEEIYGTENDALTVFKIISRDDSVAEDNFWTCFCLVYPQTAPGIAELRQKLQQLSHILHGERISRVRLLPHYRIESGR